MSDRWNEYEKLVLSQLESLQEDVQRVEDRLGDMRESIKELQVKAGFWGMLGGMVATISIILIEFMFKK